MLLKEERGDFTRNSARDEERLLCNVVSGKKAPTVEVTIKQNQIHNRMSIGHTISSKRERKKEYVDGYHHIILMDSFHPFSIPLLNRLVT